MQRMERMVLVSFFETWEFRPRVVPEEDTMDVEKKVVGDDQMRCKEGALYTM